MYLPEVSKNYEKNDSHMYMIEIVKRNTENIICGEFLRKYDDCFYAQICNAQ